MKIRVILKDPDGFFDSVQDAVVHAVNREFESSDDDEKHVFLEHMLEKTWSALNKFVSYQETVTLVFDTDEGTAIVEKRSP